MRLPLKQGLKHDKGLHESLVINAAMRLPLKQGLKLSCGIGSVFSTTCCDETSIKTRIETRYSFSLCCAVVLLR